MISRVCAVICVVAMAGISVDGRCDANNSPSIPKHYEELSCKPIRKSQDSCIDRFDCPPLVDNEGNKCFFKNKTLGPGEVLHDYENPDTCETKCFCRIDRSGGPSEITCARSRCSDKIPLNQKVKYCLRQYDKDHCCSINSVCDDDINKLATCEYDGKTFREGERFYPKNHCFKCFCTKNFNNKIAIEKNKDCYKIDCGIGLTKTRRLAEGCIPVYIKTDDCCPVGWRCPGEKHMNVPPTKSDVSTMCKFGNMYMKVGESLGLGEKLNCTCKIPPMLHCIQK